MRLYMYRNAVVALAVICVVFVMIMLDRTSRKIMIKHHETGHMTSGKNSRDKNRTRQVTSDPGESTQQYDDPTPVVSILEPDVRCNRQNTVVIYVLTTAGARQSRDQIRTTWGEVSIWNGIEGNPFRLELFFVTGIPSGDKGGHWNKELEYLTQENRKYADILVGDFSDTYETLTQKGLVALRWIENNCRLKHLAYVFKTDDDVFVNMLGLLELMQQSSQQPQPCHFLCNRFQKVRPEREGRYAISEESFPGPEYPPYCQGLGYLICKQGLPLVWNSTSRDQGTPFRLEDVYLTSLAPRKYIGDTAEETLVYHRIPHKYCVQKAQHIGEEDLYDYVMIHKMPRALWSMLQREIWAAHSTDGDKRHLRVERRKELFRMIKIEVKRQSIKL